MSPPPDFVDPRASTYAHGAGPYLLYTRALPSGPWQFRGRSATPAVAEAAAAAILVALDDPFVEAQVRRLGDDGPLLSIRPHAPPSSVGPDDPPASTVAG